VRGLDRTSFVLLYGVLAAGVPIALATNVLALWMRGDLDLLLSVRNTFELAYTLMLIAPVAGAVVGNALWGRWAPPIAAPQWEDVPSPDASVELGVDREQRRLSELKARLDLLAQTSPGALTWRVFGFALLGYVYVLAVFALIVVAILWLRHHELGGFSRLAGQMLAWFGLFILTALWVRIIEPTGQRVTRAGSPALFDALEDIQRRLDAPAPDVVVIDWQLNAGVSEIPRYGMFGLPKRVLSIGLPLLEALPADECRAILAHELAHLSRRHGRRLAWTARLSVTWENLALNLAAGRHWGRSLFLPFFRWYAPRFALYAQAIARRDEFEADALAAAYVGSDTAVRALLRLHLWGRFMTGSMYPRVQRESATSAEPPSGVFEWMAPVLRTGPSVEDIERWTPMILAERTLDHHTHPTVADRIARLGADVGEGAAATRFVVDRLGSGGGASGAMELLGSSRLSKLRSRVESDWQKATSEQWRSWHSDALVWKSVERTPDANVPFEVAWARARWATNCEPSEVALPLIREVLAREPRHLEAKLYLGRLLTESDDAEQRAEGVRILEQVVQRDTALAAVACDLLEAEYARAGNADGVDRLQRRKRQLTDAVLAGLRERRELRARDRLAPYALPAATLATVQRACAAQPSIRRAFLVRKQTVHLRDQPFVLLAIDCAVPWYKPSNGEAALTACKAVLERITMPEAATLLATPVEPRSRILRRLRKLEGAEIYHREH